MYGFIIYNITNPLYEKNVSDVMCYSCADQNCNFIIDTTPAYNSIITYNYYLVNNCTTCFINSNIAINGANNTIVSFSFQTFNPIAANGAFKLVMP